MGNRGLFGFSSYMQSTPPDLGVWTGLVLHLKADAITGKADGDPVSQWDDQSGLGNNALQGVAAKQPLFKINVCNGMPGVLFDAVDDGMVVQGLNLLTPYTIFAVYDQASGVSTTRRPLYSGTVSGGLGIVSGKHIAFGTGGSDIVGPANVNGTFVYTCLYGNGANTFYRCNGAAIGSNLSAFNPGTLWLACGSGSSYMLSGHVLEALAWRRLLDVANEIPQIEAYLKGKYAL